jgi:hypothetical protein
MQELRLKETDERKRRRKRRMKQFKGIALVVLLVALVALPAMAKIDKAPVGKGSAEVGAMISFQSQTSKADVSGAESQTESLDTLQFNGGYFLTNALEVGLSGMWMGVKPEDVDMTSVFLYNLKVAYNLQLKNAPTLLPWAAIKLGGETIQSPGSDTMQGFAYGLELGARYFVSRQASINAQLDWDASTLTVDDVDVNVNTTGVLVGLSVFFGGAK